MSFLSGKQAFLQILKQEGVDTMFGNPGTTELPLMDGLVREPSIRYILALQEAVAISMADGYAQASGKLGVVNVHTSPGLGNAMGMLYDAHEAGTPLLITAGQHDQAMNLTEPILWSDLPPVARPYVKWSHEITRIEDLPRAVRRAAKTALAHPTGPVFISLPVDVLNAERELDLLQPTRVAPRIRGDRAAIEAAADLLMKAGRPILIAGDAVAHGDALAEMAELAETLGAPVYTECVPSTCSFPFTHPLYHGPFPRLGQPIRQLLMQHDLLFSVGGDLFTLSLPSDVEPMPEGLPLIHLDLDPWEIGKNYPAQVAIQGDPKATLPELVEALRRRLTPAQAKEVSGCGWPRRRAARRCARRRRPRRAAPRSAPSRWWARSRARCPTRRSSSTSRSPRATACASSCGPATTAASTACAAAASAGACPPPSG
jgi:benzoylformate decarboxylase